MGLTFMFFMCFFVIPICIGITGSISSLIYGGYKIGKQNLRSRVQTEKSSAIFFSYDKNHDGMISMEEFKSLTEVNPESLFIMGDNHFDGYLDFKEFELLLTKAYKLKYEEQVDFKALNYWNLTPYSQVSNAAIFVFAFIVIATVGFVWKNVKTRK